MSLEHQEIHARLEATQQTISFLLAFGIISSFFVFMAGYYAGRKQVIEETYGVESSDTFVDIVYKAFHSLQEAFTPYDRVDARTVLKESKSFFSEEHGNKDASFKEIARCRTLKDAQTISALCGRVGCDATIVLCRSETSKGISYEWYQVRIAPGGQEKELVERIKILNSSSFYKSR